MTAEELERRAQALFEAQPHRHPRGHVPQWALQPPHLKQVFRDWASREQGSGM